MANKIKKTWSYAEITRSAEERIKLAQVRAAKSADRHIHSFNEIMAFGIFIGWDSLTCDHQKPGDRERLDKLTEFP